MKLKSIKAYFNQPLQQTLDQFSAFLSFDTPDGELCDNDKALLALLKWGLTVDGKISERSMNAFSDFLQAHNSSSTAKTLTEYMLKCEPLEPAKATNYLVQLTIPERSLAISNLIKLSLASKSYDDEHRQQIMVLADSLEIEPQEILRLENLELEQHERHTKLMRSGAGLLVALIVLLVFILTATLLRSVVFGLILSYLCLPIQKKFERYFSKKSPFTGQPIKKQGFTSKVVAKIKKVVGNDSIEQVADTTPEKHHREQLVGRACTATVVLVVFLGLIFTALLATGGVNYLNGLKTSVIGWVSEHKSEATEEQFAQYPTPADHAEDIDTTSIAITKEDEFSDKLNNYLNNIKYEFQNIPLVAWGVDEIAKILNDPKALQQFFTALLQKSGGILQFTFGMISTMSAILLDILMTIFFFSLFLKTIASNTDEKGVGLSLGNYLVRTVFNGHWLPEAEEETLREGERIISAVIFKLKAWLKGYIILISIDFIIYTAVFSLLKVPYAPILGFFAGCALLLPFIGPIVSVTLTVLVTLACGGDAVSGMQIAGILAIYLVQNGVVEQFFLYPAVIGEALGLTTLETIIVVLLGGYFAGITGMIFALPASAVIKYLVPQAYRTIKR